MRREQLESALRESPFKPFRVILTNGRAHDIWHPEFFMLLSGSAIVGHPDPAGGGVTATPSSTCRTSPRLSGAARPQPQDLDPPISLDAHGSLTSAASPIGQPPRP